MSDPLRCRSKGEFGDDPGRPTSPTDQDRPAWRCGREERQVTADRRARGGFHKDRCGTGRAQGSRNARHDYVTYTLVCGSNGCPGLVDRARARDQARKDKRKDFLPGDGCGHPVCTKAKRPQPSTYHRKQKKMIEALRTGSRILARWPAGLEDNSPPMEFPYSAALEAAKAAELALPPLRSHVKK